MDRELVRCSTCDLYLHEPYIMCAECSQPTVYLCLQCFSIGAEIYLHENNHSYEIINHIGPVFDSVQSDTDSPWSADEELRLLEAVNVYGYGNWLEIEKHVMTRSRHRCRDHYDMCYIINPAHPALPLMSASNIQNEHYNPLPAIGWSTEDMNTWLYEAGYNPARSDFTIEYADHAELDLNNIKFTTLRDDENDADDADDDDEDGGFLLYNLQLSALRIYHNVLKERRRRKTIIQKQGLINVNASLDQMEDSQNLYNSQFIVNSVHSAKLEQRLGALTVKSLKVLTRIMSPLQWDMCITRLLRLQQLRQGITLLQRYRTLGLKTYRAASLYETLKSKRDTTNQQLQQLTNMIQLISEGSSGSSVLFDFADNKKSAIDRKTDYSKPVTMKKQIVPRDYSHYPEYEKLTTSEKQYKQMLLEAADRRGGELALGQARVTCRIDVNKTRKIYNHLVTEGFIRGTIQRRGCQQ